MPTYLGHWVKVSLFYIKKGSFRNSFSQKFLPSSSLWKRAAEEYPPVWPDWAFYCTLGNFPKPVATINLPNVRQFFLKVSKSFILVVKSFLVNFYRHLATFYWSHWLCHLRRRNRSFPKIRKYSKNVDSDLNLNFSRNWSCQKKEKTNLTCCIVRQQKDYDYFSFLTTLVKIYFMFNFPGPVL